MDGEWEDSSFKILLSNDWVEIAKKKNVFLKIWRELQLSV